MAGRDIQTEKQWSFGAWLTLGLALGWLASGLLVALVGLEQPTDGWLHNPTDGSSQFAFGIHLASGPTPILASDVLLGINGQMFSANETPRFPSNLRVGQVLRYSLQRQDELIELDVPLVRVGPAGL